jgi:hypothetical protein
MAPRSGGEVPEPNRPVGWRQQTGSPWDGGSRPAAQPPCGMAAADRQPDSTDDAARRFLREVEEREHQVEDVRRFEFDCGLSNSILVYRIRLWFIQFDCGLSNSIVVYRFDCGLSNSNLVYRNRLCFIELD